MVQYFFNLKKVHFHMFTNNNWDRNLWIGAPLLNNHEIYQRGRVLRVAETQFLKVLKCPRILMKFQKCSWKIIWWLDTQFFCNVCLVNCSSRCTHRNIFEIIFNQPEIRLYLRFFDWFWSKRTSVWFSPLMTSLKPCMHPVFVQLFSSNPIRLD